MRRIFLCFFILLLWCGSEVQAQHFAVKTNALYWATASFNAGAEMRVAPKWTTRCRAAPTSRCMPVIRRPQR